ncbi:UDP-N-acetylmuramoyl-L-alanine--D-glutamate ligase [Candidatus Saccharibacteria bacterium]|nr:UDP-N-acetylmuramoyl-L-alanine--D-glutamate ligase [Candidatus Saccharibacteria bacterium]
MKIGIIGWGLEGQSAYNYFGPDNEYLIVNEHPRDDFPAESDKIKVKFINAERTPGVTGNVQDLSYLDGIDACDKIVYSVTNAKNLETKFGKNPDFWAKATTTQHLFYEVVKTKNVIGVTGTKGKGTTSTLIYRMLRASGKKAFLGGNIGTPVLDFVDKVQPDDWVVLELSSFQLYNLTYSPHIAVCLMIVPEHMDWHPDMEDYTEAKANLVRHQKAGDTAIYLPSNEFSTKIAGYSPGQKIPYTKSPGAYLRDEDAMIVIGESAIIHKSQIRLLGEHNIENICAAITAFWQVTQDIDAIKEVLTTFTGLEHRLEMVRDFNGVKYYDDSFGTTPDTAIVAIKTFAQPKIVILGGSDKGVPFDELAQTAASSNVRHVITIGQTGPAIAQLLKSKEFTSITEGLQTMPEIVAAARSVAQLGDIVLLSTGCASFGMFNDYKDRGTQFKQAVLALK